LHRQAGRADRVPVHMRPDAPATSRGGGGDGGGGGGGGGSGSGSGGGGGDGYERALEGPPALTSHQATNQRTAAPHSGTVLSSFHSLLSARSHCCRRISLARTARAETVSLPPLLVPHEMSSDDGASSVILSLPSTRTRC